MERILTVCTGNICRSPMAQAILAEALPGVTVESAGTSAMVGMPADEGAQHLMRQRGLDLREHRARQVTAEMCRRADLVLVMDTTQREWLERNYPVARGRVFRIGEHVGMDVPDPYRQGETAFREALAVIDTGVRHWLERIRKLTAHA